ncbi:hypothetical protein PHYSODRAFT_478151 [Phytophthora sojae]|uniref:PX domain-containing protein n=1 Tax=Phytophthora sojae (strain P6497) TaxID=1094619 RepID=G4YWY8_PHYSP|nr:hypothetical protein PHYSODRAFT_478151 [Phytophthora sojae]EGZ24486.1 hypothetical protein PHYSODRAFT_478151 [Phytophthora sojae]|eukprot:XP_009519774.1 hypothetical protein PHYSODRAFT_478151 [Phytophthora sojae]
MGPTSAVEDSEPRRSLDAELGRRLSQLSDSAKFAVTLNEIQRVAIRGVYDSPEHDGATMYVVDRRLLHEQDQERPECRAQRRYSDFRALRRQICEVVDVADDQMHPVWCSYCCRVLWLATYGGFPSRVPNRGVVATCTGWHRLVTRSRKHKLEHFINELLAAAKDESYRHGSAQCQRFVTVSQLLQAFLLEPHAQAS